MSYAIVDGLGVPGWVGLVGFAAGDVILKTYFPRLIVPFAVLFGFALRRVRLKGLRHPLSAFRSVCPIFKLSPKFLS
jgi:hypothetical protein